MEFIKKINNFYTETVDDVKLEGMEERLRLMHFLWLISLGFLCGIPFLIYSAVIEDYSILFIISIFLVTLISSIRLIKKVKNPYVLYNMANFVFLLMLVFFSFHETEAISRILWCYIYPISSIFLFGNRMGIFWSLLMVTTVLAATWMVNGAAQAYSTDFIWRFVVTYLAVTCIVVWLEHYKNRFQRELLRVNDELKNEIEERKVLETKLTKMAHTDGLTNLANRRSFWQNGIKELQRARRYNIPICLAVLDIDHFKVINDTYGHPAGDEVLRALSRHCTYILRSTDLLARIGGEEFAFLLLHVNLQEALVKLNKLREEIEKLSIQTEKGSIKITVSIGIAPFDDDVKSLDMLYKNADDTLYKAKQNGRNGIVLYKK